MKFNKVKLVIHACVLLFIIISIAISFSSITNEDELYRPNT